MSGVELGEAVMEIELEMGTAVFPLVAGTEIGAWGTPNNTKPDPEACGATCATCGATGATCGATGTTCGAACGAACGAYDPEFPNKFVMEEICELMFWGDDGFSLFNPIFPNGL